MLQVRKNIRTLFSCAALSAVILTGCASTKPAGKLLIVGGALSDSNEEIYSILFDEVGEKGSMGILPTASGVPEETGPESLEFFTNISNGAAVELIDMPYTMPKRGMSPVYANQIRKHTGLYFLGGDQSRILNTFRPNGTNSQTYAATKSVLANGGIIAGSSAGAAMMCDPMIMWGFSPEALVLGDPNVPDRGVGITQGMGYFPYGLIDQHFERRGRLGRLIAGLELTNQNRGYGISENRGIYVTLKNDAIEAVGTQAVMLVDRSSSTRTGFERSNILISYLGTGDRINGANGEISVSSSNMPYTTTGAAEPVTAPESIWEVEQLNNFLLDFSLSNTTVTEATDDFFTIRFSKTPETKFYVSDASAPRETISFTQMRLDLIPLPELEENLENLKREIAAIEPATD